MLRKVQKRGELGLRTHLRVLAHEPCSVPGYWVGLPSPLLYPCTGENIPGQLGVVGPKFGLQTVPNCSICWQGLAYHPEPAPGLAAGTAPAAAPQGMHYNMILKFHWLKTDSQIKLTFGGHRS